MMTLRIRAAALLAGVAIAFQGLPAQASNSVISGQIDTLYASLGSNYGFRAYLAGGVAACPGGGGFAYTNVTDDNYKVYVSTLTTAYALGRPVNMTVELVNGQCHILEVWIRSA
jgi:hypothetical protein